jgi:hypothetical protein
MADTPDLNDLIDLILIDSLMQSEDESSDAWLCHILQHFVHRTFRFTFLLAFMTKRRKKALCKPIT